MNVPGLIRELWAGMQFTEPRLKAKSSLIVSILLAVGTQHSVRAQYLHPRLKGGQKTLHQILVLPPKVNIQKDEMKGSTPMFRESEEIASEIIEMISTTLREKQIGVTTELFSTVSQREVELKYTLADIQKRFDRLEPLLLKKPKDIQEGRFSLGDDVAKLDANASADALMFIRANGTKVTTGKKIYGVLVPGSNLWSKLSVSLTVVDSKTGDVLYLAKFHVKGEFVGSPRQVLASVHRALEELPGTLDHRN